MARKKGAPSRMDLRREAEAVEAREKDAEKEEKDDDDEDEEDEEADEEEGDAEAAVAEDSDDGGDDDDAGDDDDEDGPRKKKKKKAVVKKVAAKKPAAKRTRTAKEVRMKAIWVVFDNGSKRVGVFPFNEKKEAEKLLAAKIEEKKATFFLQLIKEPLEVVEEVKEEKKKK